MFEDDVAAQRRKMASAVEHRSRPCRDRSSGRGSAVHRHTDNNDEEQDVVKTQ